MLQQQRNSDGFLSEWGGRWSCPLCHPQCFTACPLTTDPHKKGDVAKAASALTASQKPQTALGGHRMQSLGSNRSFA